MRTCLFFNESWSLPFAENSGKSLSPSSTARGGSANSIGFWYAAQCHPSPLLFRASRRGWRARVTIRVMFSSVNTLFCGPFKKWISSQIMAATTNTASIGNPKMDKEMLRALAALRVAERASKEAKTGLRRVFPLSKNIFRLIALMNW